MKFKIATPERIMLETEVDSLTLPTSLGEITILPNHIPMVANLAAGEIRYKQKGIESFFAVSAGVIEISTEGGPASGGKNTTQVVVLADNAEFGHEIDEKRAEEARERAKKLMREKVKDVVGFAAAIANLEKNSARLRVVRKHRTHTNKNLESGILKE
ncbi:MAG: ATP synthase F1 subunit epsilon [Candidatus Doudnabacteria bacterium]